MWRNSIHFITNSRIIIERWIEMRIDGISREIIIDYIWKLSGERVNTLYLSNEKEFRFQELRAIAFRWFCIKHKIKLIDLLDLLDKTNYSPTQSAVKLGIKKGDLKKNEKSI